MPKRNKYSHVILLLCAAALLFLYESYKNKFTMNDLFAPIIINIETAKPYMNNYSIVIEPNSKIFNLGPIDSSQNMLQNAVVYTEINGESIQELFVKVSGGETAIRAIDNITVFIGNKTYYFPQNMIEAWEWEETKTGILLPLLVEPYAKSVIKPWINWYGDFNFALKNITTFLVNPLSFSATLVFILLVAALIWPLVKEKFAVMVKTGDRKLEIITLFALLVFAFLLRINALTRHSSWFDDLYSSTVAANPHLPLINAFKDPGNPPLFYLVLRLWHELFGWSESSGRMLCVVIGVLGIVSLYCFVKLLCGRKLAILAALLLAVSTTHIGYSNEIRSYILQMALVPVVSLYFFRLHQKSCLKNYILYALAGAAIVNTHYYGSLLIAFNFFYYLVINRRQLFVKKTVCFIMANAVIAFSLLPFFVITAFQKALIDRGFNTWIPKPGKIELLFFAMLLLVCIAFPLVKRFSKTVKNISTQSGGILDYAVYACSFIFIAVYLVSFKRSIFNWRYLSICLPLLCSILPLAVCNSIGYGKFDQVIRFVSVVVLLQFSFWFRLFEGGYNDVYKEAQEYISMDAAAHPLRAAELEGLYTPQLNDSIPSYYGLSKIDFFSGSEHYDVVYVNPLHQSEAQILQTLSNAGLDESNVLKIRTTNGRYIWKKYLLRNSDG